MDDPKPQSDSPKVDEPASGLAALSVLGLVAFMIAGGWYLPPGANFLVTAALMLVLMLVLGLAIMKTPLGILINERNLMSLSRFQMAFWTVAVLAAYFTFALVRIKAYAIDPAQTPDPLNIGIDWHLWALIGISATSLVGSPLILGPKKEKVPDAAAVEKTAALTNESTEDVDANREGTLYANTDKSDARFTDMFQGDELNNTCHIDLAKVQMFYFTVIALVCFFVMVFKAITVPNRDLSHLPLLPDGLVTILGISNAGYLTSKSINHTKTKN